MTHTFGYRTSALEAVANVDLTGKNAIVTGGYSGIGIETAKALKSAGANVTIACRDISRANTIAAEIGVSARALDLSNLDSVKEFATTYTSENHELSILINNAAVMACPFEKTADGFELQFGTNHLGHYALTRLLLPLLINANGARVICLSSTGHMISPVVFEDIGFENREYEPWLGYGQAKTANSLTAVAIQNKFKEQNVEAFAVHPGGIMTTLQRHMDDADIQARGWVDAEGVINERFKTVEQGASTSTWAATSAELKGKGGAYLEDCNFAQVQESRPEMPSGVMSYALDAQAAEKLWQVSEQLIEEKKPHYFG